MYIKPNITSMRQKLYLKIPFLLFSFTVASDLVLFAVGGTGGDPQVVLDSVELVGLDGNPTPSCVIASFPYPVEDGVLATSDGVPILCGGGNDDVPSLDRCFKFVKADNSWVEGTEMSRPRSGHSAVQVNDKDFIIVGTLRR